MNININIIEKKNFPKIPLKILLSSNLLPISLSLKDPILKLISNFTEIKEFIKLNKHEITKILYYHLKKINSILYEEEEIIVLPSNEYKIINLGYYFYLSLLITVDLTIVNYKYSIDYILNLYNLKYNENKPLQEIIKAKIIIDEIKNYKEGDNDSYNEIEYNNKLSDINNNCLNLIQNIIKNNENFSKLNIEFNKSSNVNNVEVDEIYSKILIGLIQHRKLDDYKFIINIMEQLDLESIDLTKKLFDELIKNLKKYKSYIDGFLISNINDLCNIKKINFYYVLLRYILKKSLFIYQIPFLLDTRVIIINIINYKLEELIFKINESIKERLEYILEMITDSKYYFLKYIEYIKNKLREILNYYETFLFDTKKSDIINIKKEIEKNKLINYQDYLFDLNEAVKYNKRASIITFIYNRKIQKKIFPECENSLKLCIKDWDILEEMINNRKYEDIINNDNMELLIEYFLDENKKDSLLQIFNKEIYDNFMENITINENISNIIKESTYIKTRKSIPSIQNLNNEPILINNDSYVNNDSHDINSESNNPEKEISPQQSLFSNSYYLQENQKSQKNISEQTNDNKILENLENQEIKNSDDYNVINFIKCLNNSNSHKKKDKQKLSKTIEYLKELSNDLIIFGGINKKVYFYNNKFEELLALEKIGKDRKDWIYSIFEIKRTLNENAIKIGFCLINYLYLCNFTYKNDNNIKLNMSQKILDNQVLFCLNINKNENDYLVFNDKGINKYYELASKIVAKNIDVIHKGRVRGGIWVDDDIVAYISVNSLFNKNQNYKNNKLNFYNINTKALLKEIDINYSFNLSQNNLGLIELKDDEQRKILLCACKKYIKGQKNGIMIINYNFNNGKEIIKIDFENTGNFEVYCFCQISFYKKENESDIVCQANYKIEKTNYFLVGGFNKEKYKGIIKLYQLYSFHEEIKIEFITEIIYENSSSKNFENKSFRGPISNIIQLKKTGKILASCLDGNVYAFSNPLNNIDLIINKNNII